MAKAIQPGDRVRCRLYNSVEGRFYKDPWVATVKDVRERTTGPWYLRGRPQYLVEAPEGVDLWLNTSEVRRIK